MKINLSNQRLIFIEVRDLKNLISNFLKIDDKLRSHPKLDLENNEYILMQAGESWKAIRRMTGFIDTSVDNEFGVLDIKAQEVLETNLSIEGSLESVLEQLRLNSNELVVLQSLIGSEDDNKVMKIELKRRIYPESLF